MRKIIILFLILLSSCGGNKNTDLMLFNNIYFRIDKEESIAKITPSIKDKYFTLLQNKNVSIPLFKHVHAKDYNIYIGLPINTNIKTLVDSLFFNYNSIKTDTTNYGYLFRHNKNNVSISQYFTRFDKNIIFIMTVKNTINVGDTSFSYNQIVNRIYKSQ